jgi:hypothetical protein
VKRPVPVYDLQVLLCHGGKGQEKSRDQAEVKVSRHIPKGEVAHRPWKLRNQHHSFLFGKDISCPQPEHQHKQSNICHQTDPRQQTHHIPTRPEPRPSIPFLIHLTEKLFIPLLSPEQTDHQHSRAIRCIQCSYPVKLRREDFQDDEGKGELTESCANIGSFECTLCGTDVGDFVSGEDDGGGAVET